MLGAVNLRLTFTHEKTCFAYINSKYSANKEKNECIQLLSRDKKVLLWVVFTTGIPDRQIQINPMYCKILGLKEGLDVFVSPYQDVKILDELYIDTDSPDDQEILEHNAELLQLRILDQLRLVVTNQKAIVWISVAMPIVFTPKQTGILMNQSRIIVKMDPFKSFKGLKQSIQKPEDVKTESNFNNLGLINDGMLKPYIDIPKRIILRAMPVDSDGKKNFIHPYTVFMHEDLVPSKFKNNNVILAMMELQPSFVEEAKNENRLHSEVCVEIVPIDHIVFKSLSRETYNNNIKTVLIPKSLNCIISVENGTKINITIIDSEIEHPEHIHIESYSDKIMTEFEIIDRFKNCVVDNTNSGKKFLINNGFVKQNTQICNGFLKLELKPASLKFTILNSESFRHCTISAVTKKESEFGGQKPLNNLNLELNSFCRNMKLREKLLKKIILHINFEIHREACFKGASEIKSNILVTGLSGSGKTAICQIVQKELTVWSHIVHCRSLKGRKDIPEVLAKCILMCQEHSPAVLICDDVDSLVPPSLEGASPQDIAYYQRLAVVIKNTLQTCVGVCVLMTSLSMRSLHPTLRQSAGKPCFTAHFDIPDLEQTERAELLQFLLNPKLRKEFVVEDDDVTKMAADTAGYNVRELADYLNKKIFKAVKKKNNATSSDNTRPRFLDDISTDGERCDGFDIWGPVGGMKDVKQQLVESIFWPILYPALFPSQSCGLLLYGAPGTGKSYIGSCLARTRNMNFISVKGPELLSKYIGQSEKAVRDIFDKADMKKPCILFFDEFDSLAPKRGHDSTGVTDRVVNQLLSRLDGAEGGVSVPVIAATSRPDLLDPALLRAGRLHTHIYCALPDKNDRVEILEKLSVNVKLSDDVDVVEIAERTDGFSPADLKSLLVTAQLSKMEEQLDGKEESLLSIEVNMSDIEGALAETKPSLSKEQRLYYDVIYKRFRGENLSSEEKKSISYQKQRVTLA